MPDLFLLIAAGCVFAMTIAIFGWMRLMRETVEELSDRTDSLESRIDRLEFIEPEEIARPGSNDGGF